MPESFRELNRLRRQQNAFEHLREYAVARGMPDPDAAARSAAEALHPVPGQEPRRERPKPAPRKTSAPTAAPKAAAAAPPAPAAPVEEPEAAAPAAPAAPAKEAEEPSTPVAEAAGKESEPEEAPPVPHRLEDRTKDQLYARAQELEIEGRSQMTKDQLIEAIRAAQ